MNLEEKLRIAHVLEEMGVDVIEAGFPIASNGDFEAVREIGRVIKKSTIAGLSRANRRDIDRAAEALQCAERKRIHTFISTSPLHMKYKLQMEPEKVLEAIWDSVTHARNLVDDVEWSAEDGIAHRARLPVPLRRDRDQGRRHARSTSPTRSATACRTNTPRLFTMLINRVPNADKAIFSVHCHNDLGLAVANSLAGVAGRRPADRMHDQRPRRARGQRGAGRDRHGDAHPRRRHALHHRHPHRADHDGLAPGLGRHRLRRSSRTRRSSARTPSRMNPASTRTAC